MTTILAIETIGGLPAHPLLVHIPVVLIPLVAVGSVGMAIWPSWRERFGVALLALSLVAAGGAFLAADAGESLAIARSESAGSHQQQGDWAKVLALLLFLALAAVVLPPLLEARAKAKGRGFPQLPKWLTTTVLIGTAVVALAATGAVIRAGHSGAKLVWETRTRRAEAPVAPDVPVTVVTRG